MSGILIWLPLAIVLVALGLGIAGFVSGNRARLMATPTPEMKRLAAALSEPEGAELLSRLMSQVQDQESRLRELESAAEIMNNQLRGAVQKIGLHRFNSEKGIGGNLSFALVMLDARNHGFILTSIHNLDSCRIFLRGIISGKTDHPLLPEEEQALQQALQA